MKPYKVNVLLTAAVSILILFSSCTSVPQPREESETLLIIHTTSEIQTSSQRGLELWLFMDDGSKYRLNFTQPDNLTLITKLKTGTVRTKFVRARLNTGMTSTSGKSYFDYPLRVEVRLERGHYSILPAAVNYRQIMRSQGNYTFTIDFRKVDTQEKKKISYLLEEMNISQFWKKSE